MLITLKTANLVRGLNIVSTATKSDPNLPILSHILLEASRGRLRLSSTDLEIGANTLVRGKVDTDGSLALPAKTFINYLNTVSSDELILKAEGNTLLIKGDDGRAKINGMAGDDFPFQYSLIKKIKSNFLLNISGSLLKERINRTVGSAARDETRPELAGVLWWLKEKNLILVATDSYRLAENTFEVLKSGSEEIKMIVSAASCQALARIIQDEEVGVYYSDNQILFEFGDNIFTARLTEGNYPDYKQIIPDKLTTAVVVKKIELATAVKRTSIFVGSLSSAIALNFDDKDSQIVMKASGGDLGSSDSKVKAIEFSGPAQEVLYNWQYVLDGLNNVAGDKVLFETAGPDKPAIMTSAKKDGFIYLVMPVRS